jgi:hypothetical protein
MPRIFGLTGGQVHDSQVVGEVLDTPRPPLAVTADKAYDREKVRQQIKDEGALPVIPSRSTVTKKACHQESILSQALLPTTPQNRKLLLPYQGLASAPRLGSRDFYPFVGPESYSLGQSKFRLEKAFSLGKSGAGRDVGIDTQKRPRPPGVSGIGG